MSNQWLWYILLAVFLFISFQASSAVETPPSYTTSPPDQNPTPPDQTTPPPDQTGLSPTDPIPPPPEQTPPPSDQADPPLPDQTPPPPDQTPPPPDQTGPPPIDQTPPPPDQAGPPPPDQTGPPPPNQAGPPPTDQTPPSPDQTGPPPTDQTPPSPSDETPPYYTPPTSDQTPPDYQTPPSLFPPPTETPPYHQTPPYNPRNGPQETTDYYMLSPVERTGQQRASCQLDESFCYLETLTCPAECPTRRPLNHVMKSCYIDCSSKCEATCKWRKPNCNNYGALCYDPRFVGGDGNMFYFHGFKGSDFAIVSDDDLQINAHFIGTRPAGRTRDFTWVQALSIMFDQHSMVLAAKKVSKWDDKVESLLVKWNGEVINVPMDGEAEWRIITENRIIVVERTDNYNTVRATISGLVQVDIRVVPIGEQENKVHHYHIPGDDAFAHLETEFKFFKLSASVEGILGRTYQPGFESQVKMGVAMPMMGGEDKYQTPSLTSPLCKACKFQRPSSSSNIAMITAI